MLALLILAGGTGLAVVTEASDNTLPKSTTQVLAIGEMTYTAETDIPGYDYVGYVHTYSDDVPVGEEGTVTVNYQTAEGVSLVDTTILKGIVGDNYVAEKKVIEGYTFKAVTGSVPGVFTKENQVVTFIYEKEIEDGNVVVKYQDTLGNPLAEDELLTGKGGEDYLVEPKAIEGYFFFSTSESTSGTFVLEDQVITLVYSFGPPQFGLIILRQSGVIQIPDPTIYYKVTYQDLNGNVIDWAPSKIEEITTIYDYVTGAFIGGPYTVYATVMYEA